MLRKLLFAAAFSLAITTQAHAFLSTERVLDLLDKGGVEGQMTQMYMTGMAEAYLIAGIAGKEAGGPIFCFPKDQGLQTEELLLMVSLSLKRTLNKMAPEKKPKFLSDPVSLSLLLAWRTDFPCR
ncbi:hypothetical protein [Pusillimonas sp. ANT_WB101]|uniref:hypothetical protein n=1 Tax=Pusillimonas sp. ANT_WB101 TaxID=2597356 RepID=UPI0011EE00C7|nr:hypothetical protein [Pusillimonas sp. ANT_WB101]KAA0889929.1 hypothetical protein FQ179_16360 [Pusillimonas sp. ANT_WB101]